MLAEMGEHQLTIRDYLRHSNLHVTNKYLQATSKTKRLAQDKLVDAILPDGVLSAKQVKPNPIGLLSFVTFVFGWGHNRVRNAYRPQTAPDLLEVRFVSALKRMAGTTGLEPATSAVTGQRSNQLNYVPSFVGMQQIQASAVGQTTYLDNSISLTDDGPSVISQAVRYSACNARNGFIWRPCFPSIRPPPAFSSAAPCR